jgi:hypothetical protein
VTRSLARPFAVDVGVIHPRRALWLALLLSFGGLGLVLQGFEAVQQGVPNARAVAAVLGALLVLFGLPMAWNFWCAGKIAGALAAGQGVIASWHVAPALVRRFRTAEASARTTSMWRARAQHEAEGLTVAFAPESILVGDRLLPSAGMQALRVVAVAEGDPPVLALTLQTHTAIGGRRRRSRVVTSHLRVPAPDVRMAESVRAYYQRVLSGEVVIAPRRWTWRFRLGLVMLIGGAVAAGLGFSLAALTDFRADGSLGLLPMILAIAGPLVGAGGLVLTLAARSFQREQFGRG